MRRNLRQDILTTAQALFNEKGYRKTTMRDISGSLGISLGNLTYHFHKKEEIMFELLKRPEFLDWPVPDSYSALFALFNAMLDSLVVNEFFYVEDELGLATPQFHRHNLATVNEIQKKVEMAFALLADRGLFSPWYQPQELQATASMIMMSHILWIKNRFYQPPKSHLSQSEFLSYHWQLLRRHIPASHWSAYQQILTEFHLTSFQDEHRFR